MYRHLARTDPTGRKSGRGFLLALLHSSRLEGVIHSDYPRSAAGHRRSATPALTRAQPHPHCHTAADLKVSSTPTDLAQLLDIGALPLSRCQTAADLKASSTPRRRCSAAEYRRAATPALPYIDTCAATPALPDSRRLEGVIHTDGVAQLRDRGAQLTHRHLARTDPTGRKSGRGFRLALSHRRRLDAKRSVAGSCVTQPQT